MHLRDAVAALIDPQTQVIDGQWLEGPSLYQQLRDAVPGEQGTGQGAARSMPPLWVDTVDLLGEIDTAIAIWQPAYGGVPPTVGRLRGLLQHHWRPQDVHDIEQITRACNEWGEHIESLLSPQHVKHVSAPCPACGTKTVLHRDSAGELVRAPALQIGAEQGCTCQACRYTWAPDRYIWLCKVLGFGLPEGVLE